MATKRRAETAQENREKMIQAARRAFAEKGYAAASMDELTASVGLTRGALYHNFTDKKGLLAAVVAQIDGEMAANAKAVAAAAEDDWERLLAEGIAYIKMALVPVLRQPALYRGFPLPGGVAALRQRGRADPHRSGLVPRSERKSVRTRQTARTGRRAVALDQ